MKFWKALFGVKESPKRSPQPAASSPQPPSVRPGQAKSAQTTPLPAQVTATAEQIASLSMPSKAATCGRSRR